MQKHSEDHMDDMLRQRLGGYKPKLDPKAWSAIASETGGYRGGAWKYWITALSLLFLTALVYFLYNFDQKSRSKSAQNVSPTGLYAENIKINGPKQRSIKPVNHEENAEKMHFSDNPSGEEKSNQDGVVAISGRKTDIHSQDQGNVTTNQPSVTNTKANDRGINNPGNSNLFLNNNIPEVQNNAPLRKADIGVKEFNTEKNEKVLDRHFISFLSAKGIRTPGFHLHSIGKPKTAQDIIKPEEEKNNKKASEGKFDILMMGGPMLTYRTLNSDVHHDLVNHKDSHEDFIWSYSGGLMAGFQLNQLFKVRTGLIYSRLGEEYNFAHDLITHHTTNTYEYLSIPLMINITIVNNEKFGLSFSGGGKFNHLINAQSSWVDEATVSPVAHDNSGPASPFAPQRWSWGGDVQLQYKLTSRWNLYLIQSADRFLGSVYKENVQLTQRPYSFSTMIGVGIDF